MACYFLQSVSLHLVDMKWCLVRLQGCELARATVRHRLALLLDALHHPQRYKIHNMSQNVLFRSRWQS
jgi:alkylhydroperoxidase family enzyme